MPSPLPILYSFRRCPYAMRARMALAYSGQSCFLREVKLSAKPAALLTASPKGTVPVLVLPNGTVIDQSLDIMTWALMQNDPDGWLINGHAEDASLIAINDSAFKHHLDRYKYPGRYDSIAVDHRNAAMAILMPIEERLTNHAYLTGHRPSLADYAIMPFIRQFEAVDSPWFKIQPIPGIHTWLAALTASPLFTTVMINVPVWQDGDTERVFPNSDALPGV